VTISASFWTLCGMGPYVAAIPYTTQANATGPYLWSNQGQGNQFVRPNGAPGYRVGAPVGQFLFLGDLWQQIQTQIMTGDGVTTSFSGGLSAPLAQSGQIYDQLGALAGSFNNGLITGTGKLASGSINYTTGTLTLTFGSAPANADAIYASYIQSAPYRVGWSAIGDPTNYPTPLTQAALAAQSGFQDLETPEAGPVMFIAGYPLYALIFQRFGITRASYVGGAVVFSFVPYEFTRGLVAHGGAVQVGAQVFYLSDEGFMVTDGASVVPFGTDAQNSSGIDNWFWANVNQAALGAIRGSYDAQKRTLFFAIPTASNVLPDTLLAYNIMARRWTRAAVASQTLWGADNGADGSPGTRQLLGVIDQSQRPSYLNGAPMTGYLESCDLYYVDGIRRLCTGVKPQVASTDLPLITVGARDSLQEAVRYGASAYPDALSREAPALSSGKYLRLRTQSMNATSLEGGTLTLQEEGPI